MTTRDVLRWNFHPFDMLLIAGIALAGFAMGVLDLAAARIERTVDEWGRLVDGEGIVNKPEKWKGESIDDMASDVERYRTVLEELALMATEYDAASPPAPDSEEVVNWSQRVGANGLQQVRLTVGMLRAARRVLSGAPTS